MDNKFDEDHLSREFFNKYGYVSKDNISVSDISYESAILKLNQHFMDEKDTAAYSRKAILKAANAAINGPRQSDYGSAKDNFTDIANYWSIHKGVEFTPEDVAIMMVLTKVSRLRKTPTHLDSWVDIVGYAALGGEVANS